MMSEAKKRVNIIVFGGKKSGKSTVLGHLIYRCGGVDEKVMKKYEKSVKHDKTTSKYAVVFDRMRAAVETGISVHMAFGRIVTETSVITIVDISGHKDFAKTMLIGSSMADAAVLVVDASPGAFEAGMGPDGQIRKQLLLAYSLGVRALVVAVNKMDATEPPYSMARFQKITQELAHYFDQVGYPTENIPFVPVSGWHGDNLADASANMDWYAGWKFTGETERELQCTEELSVEAGPPNRGSSIDFNLVSPSDIPEHCNNNLRETMGGNPHSEASKCCKNPGPGAHCEIRDGLQPRPNPDTGLQEMINDRLPLRARVPSSARSSDLPGCRSSTVDDNMQSGISDYLQPGLSGYPHPGQSGDLQLEDLKLKGLDDMRPRISKQPVSVAFDKEARHERGTLPQGVKVTEKGKEAPPSSTDTLPQTQEPIPYHAHVDVEARLAEMASDTAEKTVTLCVLERGEWLSINMQHSDESNETSDPTTKMATDPKVRANVKENVMHYVESKTDGGGDETAGESDTKAKQYGSTNRRASDVNVETKTNIIANDCANDTEESICATTDNKRATSIALNERQIPKHDITKITGTIRGDHPALDGSRSGKILLAETRPHVTGRQNDRSAVSPRKPSKLRAVSLKDALDGLKHIPGALERPLRIAVISDSSARGRGTLVSGCVASGTLKPGMTLTFAPRKETALVKYVLIDGEEVAKAIPGDFVTFKASIPATHVRQGHVCGDHDVDPPTGIRSFMARILVMHPTTAIAVGSVLLISCHTERVKCKILSIEEQYNRHDGSTMTLDTPPTCLEQGEAALVRLMPNRALCVESFTDYPPLGRFVMQRRRKVLAVGLIVEVNKMDTGATFNDEGQHEEN